MVASQILEVHVLNVKADASDEFLISFRRASEIIAAMPGYVSHELRRSAEASSSYLLLINWRSLGNHIIGIRQSPDYRSLAILLGDFYDQISSLKQYYGPTLNGPPIKPTSQAAADLSEISMDDFL